MTINYEIKEITKGVYGHYIVTRKSEKYGIFRNGILVSTDSSKKSAQARIETMKIRDQKLYN